jgi:ubiquinone/menaquinone biosynthesis C-methylase UbiE
MSGQFKWSACDVNPFSIEWANNAFGNRANIFLSNAWPPLPVADQSFDVVFAWSIFSHYSEAAHRAWLEEMYRVLRSNGYLLLSFQSDYLLDCMRRRDMIEQTRSQGVDLKAFTAEFDRNGFNFYRTYAEVQVRVDVRQLGFDPGKLWHGVHFEAVYRQQLDETV